MVRLCSFILIALFVAVPLFPFEISGRFFEMEADDVAFDSQNNDIQAKGNVSIVIEDYLIRADEFYYNDQSKELLFKGQITITKDGVTVVADTFTYNTELDTGNGVGIRTFIDGVFVYAHHLQLNPEKGELFDLVYSTCDRKESRHYEMKAERLEVFRKKGNMVSHSNDVYFYNRKLFSYSSLEYDPRKGGSQSFSRTIPDIGRNKVDGDYIKVYRPYYWTKRASGNFVLGVTQRRGSMLGVKHSYKLSNSEFLTAKSDYYVKDSNFDGGLIYERSFFNTDSSSAKEVLEGIFFNKGPEKKYFQIRKGLFSAHYMNNEVVNSTLVNYYPMIRFDYWDYSSVWKSSFRSTVSTGYFEDESAKTNRHHVEFGISKLLKETPYYILNSEVQAKGSIYKGEESWKRSFGVLSISFPRTLFNPGFSYTRRLLFKGNSPFLFDSYNTVSDDELGASFEGGVSQFRWGVRGNYMIKEEKFRSAIMELGVIHHCWGIYISTDVILSNFLLGVSINKL